MLANNVTAGHRRNKTKHCNGHIDYIMHVFRLTDRVSRVQELSMDTRYHWYDSSSTSGTIPAHVMIYTRRIRVRRYSMNVTPDTTVRHYSGMLCQPTALHSVV